MYDTKIATLRITQVNGEHFVGGFDVSDQHTNAVLHIFLKSDSKQNARKKVDLTRLKLVVSVW